MNGKVALPRRKQAGPLWRIVFHQTEMTQKCVAYKHVGDACTFGVDIFACEPGSSCDQATAKCKADSSLICQAP